MTGLPSWGNELEAYRRRQERREAWRAVLLALGAFLGALAVLVIGWLMCVGFLVTFG